jgi:protein-S-isoprenylcysteine O-methyltransferase Ste14
MHALGAYYSRTLRSAAEQGVVDTGPYRLVRHPGYAAYSRRTKKIIPFAW